MTDVIKVDRGETKLKLTRIRTSTLEADGWTRTNNNEQSRTLDMEFNKRVPYVRGSLIALAGLGVAAAPFLLAAGTDVAVGIAAGSLVITTGALVALHRHAEAQFKRMSEVFGAIRTRVFDEATQMANDKRFDEIDAAGMVAAGFQEAADKLGFGGKVRKTTDALRTAGPKLEELANSLNT